MSRRFLVGSGPTSGSGTASRPPNPVPGQLHWRTDKLFMETYDGTAWRVYGLPVVAALADISNPITGQKALLTTDGRNYRYTGSAWALDGGVIARGVRTTSSTAANPSPVLRLDGVPVYSGRCYRVTSNNINIFGAAGDTDSLNIRFSSSGNATSASPEVAGGRHEMKLVNGGGAAAQFRVATDYFPTSDLTISFLLIGERNTGSGTVQVYGDATSIIELTIEDLGPAPSNTAVIL
jgi:hypothetical protein